MRFDTTLKDLFQEPPQRLLHLLVGRKGVQLLSAEFSSTQKRLPDLLFLLDNNAILHLELQSTPENMKWRMLEYYAMIRQRYPKQPLIQKVLYVGRNPWHPTATLTEPNLQFRYDVVDMRDIACQELLSSPKLEENILAILCRPHYDRQIQTIRAILHRISKLKPKAREDALMKLVVLSGLRHLEIEIHKEAEEMAITVDLMKNAVLRGLILKRLAKTKRKAIQEGIREGKLEGKLEGEILGRQLEASAMLIRLLRRRFGTLPALAETKLTTASLEELETWSDRILDATSLEEIFQET